MQELDINEIEKVYGGVSQEAAIGTNMSIVAIGAGIAVAGSAPAWFPIAMIAVSIATTYTYVSSVVNE